MIKYVKGDATHMLGGGNKILSHIVNNKSGWGAGFVLAISKRWKEPEQEYRKWSKEQNFKLGSVQFIQVEKYVQVANMLCQKGYKSNSNPVPLQYDHLRTCLEIVSEEALKTNSSIHMPRIGTNLAGGSWAKIEPIIIEELCSKNISVIIYNFD